MNRLSQPFYSLLLVSGFLLFAFNSCKTEAQKDAMRFALLECEAKSLTTRYPNKNEAYFMESRKLSQQARALQKELEKKYQTADKAEEFRQALVQLNRNCD